MIAATVFNINKPDESVLVQLEVTPRVGELLTIAMPGERERDLRVCEVNHLIRELQGDFRAIELVIFATPDSSRNR